MKNHGTEGFSISGKHAELLKISGSPCLLERCILEVRPVQIAGQQACGPRGRVRNAIRENRINALSPRYSRGQGQFISSGVVLTNRPCTSP